MTWKVGEGTVIHRDAFIDPLGDIEIGDNCYIGQFVRIIGKGTFKIGDYSKVHFGTFINAYPGEEIVFGHNCWIAERCVIDGEGGIQAGNNICVGFGSQLTTHIGHGDVMEGCNFHSKKRMILEDDVWISGNCSVAGVHIANKSLVLPGSVVSKDIPSNRVFAGVPAQDITHKIGSPFTVRSSEEKLKMFEDYVEQFARLNPDWEKTRVRGVVEFPASPDPNVTYFNVTTREYTKRFTDSEVAFMKWLISWKARFSPRKS